MFSCDRITITRNSRYVIVMSKGVKINDSVITTDLVIKKSNELSVAGLNLSLQELRILDTAIGVYNETQKTVISFSIRRLYEVIGKNTSSAYRDVENLTDSLMQKFVSIQTQVRGKNTWIKQTLVKRSSYIDGVVELEFDEDAMYLISSGDGRDTNFTQYNAIDGMAFDTVYATRLFSVLATHAFKGFYKDDIQSLRKRLNVEEGKYSLFGHLKSRVIEPSIKKINEKGVFIIPDIQYLKEGKKVVGVQFEIIDNRKKLKILEAPIQAELLSDEDHYISLLMNAGFNKEIEARKFLPSVLKKAEEAGLTGLAYIQSNISYVRSLEQKDGKEKGGGYLRQALLSDYASRYRIEPKLKPEKEIDPQEAQINLIENQYEELSREFRKELVRIIQDEYEKLDDMQQINIDASFKEAVKGDGVVLETFKKRKWSSFLIVEQYVNFWSEMIKLPTLEVYAEEKGVDIKSMVKMISSNN